MTGAQIVLAFGGAVATVYGVSMLSEPAAWIVGGVGSCVAGLKLDDGKPGGSS